MTEPTSPSATCLPPLRELGTDLLQLRWRRRCFSIALPFIFAGAYFFFAFADWWPGAVLALMALSFVTYGSTSHDLVHRSLGLPAWANELLLCVIELLALRSGHSYRAGHLHHHARFPADDDIEGAAAKMTWPAALFDGLTLQLRVWRWAIKQASRERRWMFGESVACLALLIGSAILAIWTPIFLVYVALMIAGSWLIPLATSYIPHVPDGTDELSRTRAYRGTVASIIGLGHLYHLEHHLYPSVPHQNWRELARRLDTHLERAGVSPLRLWF